MIIFQEKKERTPVVIEAVEYVKSILREKEWSPEELSNITEMIRDDVQKEPLK